MVELQNKNNNNNIISCDGHNILFSFIPAPKFITALKNHMIISMKLMIPSDPVNIEVKQITQTVKLTKTINCNGHKFMMEMSMFYCSL